MLPLALRGQRVLLVDVDPHASLTTFMGFEPHESEETIADAILQEEGKLLIQADLHKMIPAPTNITFESHARPERVVVDGGAPAVSKSVGG